MNNGRDFGGYSIRRNAIVEPVQISPPNRDSAHQPAVEYSVHHSIQSLEREWRQLEKQSNVSIYQRFDWVSACIETIDNKPNSQVHIVTGRLDGRLVMIMPLLVKSGVIPKITWIGGNHSNYNMIILDRQFIAKLNSEDIIQLLGDIIPLLPKHGYLKLCCQPVNWGGQNNPLLALAHQHSTNVAFGMDLSAGFENVLSAGNGKRKRKKFRTQSRAVEALGGAELVLAKSIAQATEILECFHVQKADRLHDQGIRDVFSKKHTHQFLKLMADFSLTSNEPILSLYGLKIDGKYQAICGGGVLGKHFSAYFTSFANNDLASISPGEMLLYMLVKQLADTGYEYMDLGVGEERYKRSWCPDKINMFDIIIPLSPLSYGHVFAERMALVMRRKVRESPILWKYFKRNRVSISKIVDIFYGANN